METDGPVLTPSLTYDQTIELSNFTTWRIFSYSACIVQLWTHLLRAQLLLHSKVLSSCISLHHAQFL